LASAGAGSSAGDEYLSNTLGNGAGLFNGVRVGFSCDALPENLSLEIRTFRFIFEMMGECGREMTPIKASAMWRDSVGGYIKVSTCIRRPGSAKPHRAMYRRL